MATVFLGIGSNLGDREAHIEKALTLLKEHKEIDVIAVSSLIETEAVGGIPQPRFLNGAVKTRTDLKPLDLLAQLKIIERRLGRGKHGPNEPRSIDLDILFYEDIVILEGKNITIPHPRLAERYFVLKPLAEIAPDFRHPRLQKTVQELYDELTNVGSQDLQSA